MRTESSLGKVSTSPNKATALHKVLRQDEFRKATEASWAKQSSEAQSLDLLSRCKKLNEFLEQGLLSEVEDDVLQSLNTSTARPVAVQRALAQGRQHSNRTSAVQQGTSGRQPQAEQGAGSGASCSSREPLTSRITAKESAFLLELLQDECQQQDCFDTSQSAGISPDSAAPESAEHATVVTAASATGPAAAAAGDELDVICLLNQPTAGTVPLPEGAAKAAVNDLRLVLDDLHRQQLEQAARCIQCAFRCKQAHQQLTAMRATTKQQIKQQQQLHQHLQHLRLEPHSQQLSGKDKRSTVSLAWEGYYKYWGVHAACVIQRYWRRHTARRLYNELQQAACVLQACVRGWHYRQSSDNQLPAYRQQMLQRLLQQQQQEHDRQQRQAAAVVLQCCIRGWRARRISQSTLDQADHRAESSPSTVGSVDAQVGMCWSMALPAAGKGATHGRSSTAAAIATAGGPAAAGKLDISDTGISCSGLDSRPADRPGSTSSCSSSDSISEQPQSDAGQAVIFQSAHRMHKNRKAPAASQQSGQSAGLCAGEAKAKQTTRQLQASRRKPEARQHNFEQSQQASKTVSRCASSCTRNQSVKGLLNSSDGALTDADALMARQLVIRSAADTRTATQHCGSEANACMANTSGLLGDLMQRADELLLGEHLQQSSLSLRTTMAGSSFRGIQ